MLKKLVAVSLLFQSMSALSNGPPDPKVKFYTDKAAWTAAANVVIEDPLLNPVHATEWFNYESVTFDSGFKYTNWDSRPNHPMEVSATNGIINDAIFHEEVFIAPFGGQSEKWANGFGANFDLSPNGTEQGIQLIAFREGTFGEYIFSPTLTQSGFLGLIANVKLGAFKLQSAGESFSMDQVVMAVPEPATYAMMLAGLGMIGMMKRRRRAVAA